ncbi:MAG: sel1 repeat family protein [Nitrospinae bacterium]|nr:sel1 repeat family protein [Nitrospinota bacterium]
MTKTWLGLSMVGGSVLMLATSAWADSRAGEEAYRRGDFETAVKELRPLGEQGDTLAQFNLGAMYERGQGVPQDSFQAVRWYRRAAEQGLGQAQFNLGLLYNQGQGVMPNVIQAYMWVLLAAVEGIESAIKVQEIMMKDMTPAQIMEAERLAREWRPKGKE